MSSKAAQNHKICSNKITEGLIKTKFSVITKNQTDRPVYNVIWILGDLSLNLRNCIICKKKEFQKSLAISIQGNVLNRLFACLLTV